MCIGSNHLIRARAMYVTIIVSIIFNTHHPRAMAGWWPTWTVSEDVGLAQEMAKLGTLRGTYVDEVLAIGEIPLTTADKYIQYTRFNQGYWTNWLGCHGRCGFPARTFCCR